MRLIKQILLFCILILLLILPSFALKEPSVLIFTNIKQDFEIIDIIVAENNIYYSDYFYDELIKDNTNYSIILLNQDKKPIYDSPLDFDSYSILPFNNQTSEIIVYSNIAPKNKIIYQQNISFCNNNGICEYFNEDNIVNIENVLTCKDCSFNSRDNYCDLKSDGICDPDCVANYECENCKTKCLFEEEFTIPSNFSDNQILKSQNSTLWQDPVKDLNKTLNSIIIFLSSLLFILIAITFIIYNILKKNQKIKIINSIDYLLNKGYSKKIILKTLKKKYNEKQIKELFQDEINKK